MIIRDFSKYWEDINEGDMMRKLGNRGLDIFRGKEKEIALDMVGDDVLESDDVVYVKMLASLGVCSDSERFHQAILFQEATCHYSAPRYRDGLFVAVNEQIVGYVKLAGERTFLATRTVKNSYGPFPLVKGGIYNITEYIQKAPLIRENWLIKKVKMLGVKPARMFYPGRSGMSHLVEGEKKLNLDARLEWVTMLAQRALEEEIVREKHKFEVIE